MPSQSPDMAEDNVLSFGTFKERVTNIISGWERSLNFEERKIEDSKKRKKQLEKDKEALESLFAGYKGDCDKAEADKEAKLAEMGIKDELDRLNQELKALTEENAGTDVFPECPVCTTVCNPSEGRPPCSCPKGHSICGPCGDKADRCPVCHVEKSSFGGTFIRNMALERLASSGAQMMNRDAFQKMHSITLKIHQAEARKMEVEKSFQEVSRQLLMQTDTGLRKVKKFMLSCDYAIGQGEANVKQFKKYLGQILAQMEKTPNSNLSMAGYSLACHCPLACPHPLSLDADGRMLDPFCNCVKARRKPCLCVTHSVVLKITIGGEKSQEIKAHLAGRTHPHTVNRFYRVAANNEYAGTVVHWLTKNRHMKLGKYKEDDLCNIISTSDDGDMDADNWNILPTGKYSLGYMNGEIGGRTPGLTISLSQGGVVEYRTIGRIVEGAHVLEAINALAGSDATVPKPTKTVKIESSTVSVVQENIKL